MINYCLGFLFNKNETDVLLIEKQTPEWQRGYFNGIGGKVNTSESPLEAMTREFREEAGLDIEKWNRVISIGNDEWHCEIYASKSDDIFNAKSLETEKVNIIGLHELDKYSLIPNLYWIIPLCQYSLNNRFNYSVRRD